MKNLQLSHQYLDYIYIYLKTFRTDVTYIYICIWWRIKNFSSTAKGWSTHENVKQRNAKVKLDDLSIGSVKRYR